MSSQTSHFEAKLFNKHPSVHRTSFINTELEEDSSDYEMDKENSPNLLTFSPSRPHHKNSSLKPSFAHPQMKIYGNEARQSKEFTMGNPLSTRQILQ